MKRLSATPGYARFRLGLGVLFIVLGLAISYRTVASMGLRWEEVPSFILSAALIALGGIRVQQALTILRGER